MTTSTYRTRIGPQRGEPRGFMPFRTPVRGHVFAARPPDVDPPHAGQAARLVREPDNPRDPLATAVWIAGSAGPWRIGYLERAVAARIAPRLDRGSLELEVRVDGWQAEPGGRWRRPVVVLVPTAVTTPSAPATRAREPRGHWGEPPRSVVRTLRSG